MDKAIAISRKRRVYEVCLSVFFVFSTSACANMGNTSSSLDDDLEVDLLAVLTEPEQKDMELEAEISNAEMVADYQNSADESDPTSVEEVSDPFGDAFSGTGSSEVAEDSSDEVEVDAPIISELDSEPEPTPGADGDDVKSDNEHAKADLEDSQVEEKDLSLETGQVETLEVQASAAETSQTYLDLNEDESVDFLLENGESTTEPALHADASDAVPAETSAEISDTGDMLLAAMGEDSAGFVDDESAEYSGNKDEFQDAFLSGVIIDQETVGSKKTNYLAETTFEPNSEVPIEMDTEDYEIDMGAMIAGMQTEQQIPGKASVSSGDAAMVARANPTSNDALKVKIPESKLVAPEILPHAPIVAAIIPAKKYGDIGKTGDQVDHYESDDFEQATLALLENVDGEVQDSPTAKGFGEVSLPNLSQPTVLRSDKRLASSSQTAIISSNTQSTNKIIEKKHADQVQIENKIQVAAIKRLKPENLHLQILRSPDSVAYSGKRTDTNAPEKMVKVYIDGRPALVGVRKPLAQPVQTAHAKHSNVKPVTVATQSKARQGSAKSHMRIESNPIRLALVYQGKVKVLEKTPMTTSTEKPQNSKERESSHFDLTNKLILPKRDELFFG